MRAITYDAMYRKPTMKQAIGYHSYCFVLPWTFLHPGGVNQVINNLMNEFRSDESYGIKPIALELKWRAQEISDVLPDGTIRFFGHLRSPYVPESPIIGLIRYLLELPGSLVRLRRLISTNNILAFNLHSPGLFAFNFVLLKAIRIFKGKIILSFHGSDIRQALQSSSMAKRIWRWILRHSLVVACSNGLKEEVHMLERKAQVITIHNGIEISRFAAYLDPSFLLPERMRGKTIIVNVAAFEHRKGHDTLLRAFHKIVGVRKDLVLLLIGASGPASEAVRDYIKKAELYSAIFIEEGIQHAGVYNFLLRSHLFVLASRWQKGILGEGFVLAILEAAAVGLPVVATASCGVEELIQNYKTGLVVPPDDPMAMAEAIMKMLDNPVKAQSMAVSLHNLVRDKFTWQEAAKKYSALLGTNSNAIRRTNHGMKNRKS